MRGQRKLSNGRAHGAPHGSAGLSPSGVRVGTALSPIGRTDLPAASSSAIRLIARLLAQTHFSIPINERVCHLEFFLYFIRTAAQFLLIVIEIAMFVRAVISFVPSLQGGIFDQFSYAMSEPFIVPMRILLDRFESVRNLPVDVPFFITFLLISVIQTLLT